ncbi:unnamed protein product, partial [Tetraodon nigroviridis]
VTSEWSAIEKEMGDGLQSAGHHMDTYAASIDDILEEEEHYADQLKEYLFYTDAVRAVCRKHELIQYELELAAQDLAYKKQQKEELVTGVTLLRRLISTHSPCLCTAPSGIHLCSCTMNPCVKLCVCVRVCAQTVRVFSLKGMTSKLFGQESQEQRESRLAALEQSIQEGEAALKQKNAECQYDQHQLWIYLESVSLHDNRRNVPSHLQDSRVYSLFRPSHGITCKCNIWSKWQLPQRLQIFFISCVICALPVCDGVYREFVQTAWEDIERFKEQKNKDLHEALISYAIMQISMCKKVFWPPVFGPCAHTP